ncbi:MAG: protein-L-isoaspartate(D-aspartate) O-methyltransferase [Chloroflexi bacterium]|nr:protein-L-isoaspartate(D-aspartate) O-methyltransferase [Chloroflexota bacterium]
MVAGQLRDRGIRQPEVLGAMGRVLRHRFLTGAAERGSYDDRAVGIGGGQTISQPFMVARMTEALDLPGWAGRAGTGAGSAGHAAPPLRVLDVGTGSGYQAAVLAEMGAEVISLERHEELAEQARERLARLGHQVEIHVGDGSEGYPARAPYAGILVAAATPRIPEPLLAQLAPGGRVAAPVGTREHQMLTVAERTLEGLRVWELEPCVFVPLIGRFGFPDPSP